MIFLSKVQKKYAVHEVACVQADIRSANVYYHGTDGSDLNLDPKRLLWLTDRKEIAEIYSGAWGNKKTKVYQIKLKPCKIVDLRSQKEPLVIEIIDLIKDTPLFQEFKGRYIPTWELFEVDQTIGSQIKKILRSHGVDGVILDDGTEGTDHDSIALLNLSKIEKVEELEK